MPEAQDKTTICLPSLRVRPRKCLPYKNPNSTSAGKSYREQKEQDLCEAQITFQCASKLFSGVGWPNLKAPQYYGDDKSTRIPETCANFGRAPRLRATFDETQLLPPHFWGSKKNQESTTSDYLKAGKTTGH